MARDQIRLIYVNSTGVAPAPKTIGAPAPITQSLASSFVTVATAITHMDACNYQINITTTDSQGTFIFQSCNDNVNFVDIGTAGLVNAANDVSLAEIGSDRSSLYVRLKYTATVPGTGTCSILFSAKQVGGS